MIAMDIHDRFKASGGRCIALDSTTGKRCNKLTMSGHVICKAHGAGANMVVETAFTTIKDGREVTVLVDGINQLGWKNKFGESGKADMSILEDARDYSEISTSDDLELRMRFVEVL